VSYLEGTFGALESLSFFGGAYGDGSGHAADFAFDCSSYLSEDGRSPA
jgi:hypothetical protein